MQTKSILPVVTVALLIGGCGSKNTPPTPVPSPPISAVHNPDDQQAAEKAVLTQADVGPGYSAVPFTPSRQDDADDVKLSTCIGQSPTKPSETARAFSKAFVAKDKRQILSSVTFVTSNDKARSDLRALQSIKGGQCVRQLFLDDLGRAPNSVKTLTIQPLPQVQATAPQICAYRLTVDIPSSADEDLVQFVDLVSAVKGRAEIQITFQDVNTPFTQSYESTAIAAILGRLSAS